MLITRDHLRPTTARSTTQALLPSLTMCRYILLSVLLLLFLSPLALCQPDMPDMPRMGDDMFDLQGTESFAGPTLAYEAPYTGKKAAPVVTKAPRMRLTAAPYTYEKPVTHYETVAVPTTHIVDDETLVFETVPAGYGSKGSYGRGYGSGGGGGGSGVGGYAGNGLWEGPGGLWPGQHQPQPTAQLCRCTVQVPLTSRAPRLLLIPVQVSDTVSTSRLHNACCCNSGSVLTFLALRCCSFVVRCDWRLRLESIGRIQRLRLIRQTRLGQTHCSCTHNQCGQPLISHTSPIPTLTDRCHRPAVVFVLTVLAVVRAAMELARLGVNNHEHTSPFRSARHCRARLPHATHLVVPMVVC